MSSHVHGAISPYYLAARSIDERASGRANRRAEQQLSESACDLSAYRFYLAPLWYVAISGAPLEADLEAQLADAVGALLARRQEVSRGPWAERHYRP